MRGMQVLIVQFKFKDLLTSLKVNDASREPGLKNL